MHSTTIIGYSFNTELICPPCLRRKAAIENEANGDNAEYAPLETLLDRWAKREGIDREDEDSFDNSDFPKVVFETGDSCCDRCGTCNETLSGGEPCVTYPHSWTLGGRGLCSNGDCRTLGSGDPCNDGNCRYHPDNPVNPDTVDIDCDEFREDGSCIHSDHMAQAGL